MTTTTGGKAFGLLRLDEYLKARRNFPEALTLHVPRWFELSHEFFVNFCRGNGIADFEDHDIVGREILAAQVPAHLMSEFLRQILDASISPSAPLAIRSNANVEDGNDASFAGIFTSEIGVSKIQYSDALKRCWASFFSPRVSEYMTSNGIAKSHLKCSLVIQECVIAPDFSGVAFSRMTDSNGTLDNLLIEVIPGYGEGLVSGLIDPLRYKYNRRSARWDNGESSTIGLSPDDKRRLETITDEIRDLLEDLEAMHGFAVDLEFCVKGHCLYLLQMRPITKVPPVSFINGDMAKAEQIVLWDSSNIAESYPGITLPLTFSHLKRSYKTVYKQFAQVMGVSKATVNRYDDVFSNMIGLCYGRVYYNLFNWYRLIYLLPNAERSSSFMEGMMGVQDSLGNDGDVMAALFNGIDRPKWWQNIYAVLMGVVQLVTCRWQVRRFKRDVGDSIKLALKWPSETYSTKELIELYNNFSKDVIQRWRAPIVNDTACMLYTGFCKNVLKTITPSEISVDSVFNAMVENRVDTFSSQLVVDLGAIALKLNSGEISGRQFVLSDQFGCLEDLQKSSHSDLYDLVKGHISRYGFRVAEELKFESKDLHQDFTPFIAALRTSLTNIRIPKTKNTMYGQLSSRGIKRYLLKFLVSQAAQAIADREHMRYMRTEAFAVAKRIFLAISQHLVSAGALKQASDIHYLTIEELEDYIHGRIVSSKLDPNIQLRKAEYLHYQQLNPPSRFLTRGPTGLYLQFPNLVLAQIKSVASTGDLIGTPCAPGLIEGEALVAMTFAEAKLISNQILVAKHTDPAWITLYPACKALVIECGSTLSHAAVVAREMGIPTIVGARGITSRVKSGDKLRVNGSSGRIECVDKP